MAKRYPFSMVKHAHDVEFRYNRVSNILDDIYHEGKAPDIKNLHALEDLKEKLQNLLIEMMNNSNGRVTLLAGEDYALAKECAIWAATERDMKGANTNYQLSIED